LIEQEFLFLSLLQLINNPIKHLELSTEYGNEALQFQVDTIAIDTAQTIAHLKLTAVKESLLQYYDHQFDMRLSDIEITNENKLEQERKKYDALSNKMKKRLSKEEYVDATRKNQDRQYQNQLWLARDLLEYAKQNYMENTIIVTYKYNEKTKCIEEVLSTIDTNSIIWTTPTKRFRQRVKKI